MVSENSPNIYSIIILIIFLLYFLSSNISMVSPTLILERLILANSISSALSDINLLSISPLLFL